MSNSLFDEKQLHEVEARGLLGTHESILVELHRRGIINTNGPPAGQYAKWLAKRVLEGQPVGLRIKSYDLNTSAHGRLAVRARVLRLHDNESERQLAPFHSFNFDQALVVIFDSTYGVHRAVLLPAKLVLEHSRESRYLESRILVARDALLDLGEDITAKFASER